LEAAVNTILCAGIASLDLVMGVDQIPSAPGKHRAHMRHEIGGGVAANAAVAISCLGGRALFAGCVGDDPTGDHIVDGLRAEGVDVNRVRRVSGAASPLSMVLIDRSGERMIVNHTDPDLFTSALPLDASEVSGADAVLVDMRWPSGAIPALDAARRAGIPAVVDCDHDPFDNRGLEILAAATHVIFSLPTLIALTDRTDPTSALQAAGVHTGAWVAATAGDEGVHWINPTDHAPQHMAAFPVAAVDTLGAGDVFHGAFVAALVGSAVSPSKGDLSDVIRFASAAAAIKCTRHGGRAGIPNRAEVDSFLKEHQPWK